MSSKRKYKTLSTNLISMWHPTLNGDLRPEDISGGSGKTVWFLHYDKKWRQWHEWDSTPDSMSRKENCPICTGARLVIGINDLATRNPVVAAKWHPTLNGGLTPQMVTEHSGLIRWWQHEYKNTGILHEWPMSVGKLTSKEPRKCSVCSGDRVQIGVNDLATTHPTLASEWHPTKNKKLTLQMVTKGSLKDVWWRKDCFNNRIYHEWHATMNDRTKKPSSGCAICRGLQVQRGVNDLESQYPTLVKEWDRIKNKEIRPNNVTKSCNKKVFWKHYNRFTKGWHSWPARIADRTSLVESGCPDCSNTGFNLTKPAHFYVLSATLKGVQIIQFGISNNIKIRLVDHSRSGFINIPIKLISFTEGAKARGIELSLLNLMKEYHIVSCNKRGIKFNGSTEAFCLEDTDEEFLEEFKELINL